MTPLHRSLAGNLLVFDLQDEMRTVREALGSAHARVARTLVKDGPLRLTLIGIQPGGSMREHEAAGPITIHVLEGEIVLDVGGEPRTLPAGALATLQGGVRHAVSAPQGGFFLLTIAARERGSEGRDTAGP